MKKTELIKPAWLLIKMSTQKSALINKKNNAQKTGTEKVLKQISQKRNGQSIYEKKCTQNFHGKKCTEKMHRKNAQKKCSEKMHKKSAQSS